MAEIGTGSIITFASGFFAQILSINIGGMERTAAKITHMASTEGGNFGGHDYMPGDLTDLGSADMLIHFNPDTDPPIDAASETITFDWAGNGAGHKWSCNGIMTQYEPQGLDIADGAMTARCTVRLHGDVTIA